MTRKNILKLQLVGIAEKIVKVTFYNRVCVIKIEKKTRYTCRKFHPKSNFTPDQMETEFCLYSISWQNFRF